jgi:transposase
MPKRAAALECTAEVRAKLVAMSRGRSQEARMVERARIILACLEGKEIQQVARELDASIPTVSKWRRRFTEGGLAALRDRPRPGKPRIYDLAFRDRVLRLIEQTTAERFISLGWSSSSLCPWCQRSCRMAGAA